MKSIVFGLSLMSTAMAQISVVGISMVPIGDVAAASDSKFPEGTPAPTQESGGYAAPSLQTSEPAGSMDSYSSAPYQSGGYKSIDCGYGYKKQSGGSCTKEPWYTHDGSYATTIINDGNDMETVTVTATHTNTKTATVTSAVTSVQTTTKTETMTDRITATQVNTYVQPTTLTSVWVSTQTIDKTATVEHTITSTKVWDLTMTATVTSLSTAAAAATTTEIQTVLQTGLSDCLGKCKSQYWLTIGNKDTWNTYASPSHTSDAAVSTGYGSSGGGSYRSSTPYGGY